MQREHHFETQITRQLDYLLYLPKDYGIGETKLWPLILFLHGMGERGSNLELVKKHGIARIVDEQPDFPFIAVSPQCPITSWWTFETEALKALLDHVFTAYAVDLRRVYLTGLSMGGTGAWMLGAAYPESFAAMVPICGRTVPTLATRLKDMPIWVFHGEDDPVVPADESRRMFHALEKCGGKARFTLYPGVGHDSWTQTYDNPALYEWMLEHVRL